MLTAQQIELRRMKVGGSEIGALIDFYGPQDGGVRVDPHKTAWDIFADREAPRNDNEERAAHLDWGLDMEPAILRNHARRAGLTLLEPPADSHHPDDRRWPTFAHPKIEAICATPDGIARTASGSLRNIQAKNCQHHQAYRWGAVGTDKAPLLYIAQVTLELGILRAHPDFAEKIEPDADLAVSIGGAPPVGYALCLDSELFGSLVTLAEKFVHDYLRPRKEPPITPATADSAADYIRRRYPADIGLMLEPTDEDRSLVQSVATLRHSGKALDDEKKAAEVQLKLRIGEASGIAGLCTFRKCKDTIEPATNWQAVLDALVKDKGVDRGYVLSLLKEHTRQVITRKGARRLLLTGEE